MKELQFSLIVLMTLMCSALILLLPGRVKRDAVINRSRWLMTAALALIGVQFLIQYISQLRTIGVTQAVLVNLTFFLPSSALMSLTVLNLQRQGRLSRFEQWGWVAGWLIIVAILAIALATDGQPIERLTMRVRWAEIFASIIYAGMQTYYSTMQIRELMRMKEVLNDYYDSEQIGLVKWMRHSIAITGLMALFVPAFIFFTDIVLIIYGILFFWGIFMMWFCFVRYFMSNAINQVREAEISTEENTREERRERLSPDMMQHVSQAVERWLATNGHLKAGTTNPVAAEAMNIPRYQLTAWVKASGHSSFTRWITSLRIDEAKRVLSKHPDWTNEAVADHCGFSRTHFQKIFKQETGMVPSEFIKGVKRE